VLEFDITADQLISALMHIAASEPVCILDSCGVGHLGSHLLIAGIEPLKTIEISHNDPSETLSVLDEKLTADLAAIFTLSYDFGRKMLGFGETDKCITATEPDVCIAQFDALIIHDYDTHKTFLTGNTNKFGALQNKLGSNISDFRSQNSNSPAVVTSNFTKPGYLAAIESIKEHIRSGDTYQTNLTQQLTAHLPSDLTPQIIFQRLRKDHPAPFSAFISRDGSTVISASPERFFSTRCTSPHVSKGDTLTAASNEYVTHITTSPIKGTRPRGTDPKQDEALKHDLLTSPKDLAENTMIVDLLRNDLGRVCEYGSVNVEKLCDLEEHPTLFHLVSTVSGELKKNTKPSGLLKALFPCGSITGAPKISTMQIIDEIEPSPRGLSMGAIGYYVPSPKSEVPDKEFSSELGHGTWDLSVAIRTMVIRDETATFNVGGGIVIDSDPESEYAETLTKAKALLEAIGGQFTN